MSEIRKDMENVLSELSQVFIAMNDSEVEKLADAITHAAKVFVVGVGRVLLSAQAFVKRLWHIGIPAYYVGQIDEPAATSDDLLIVVSNSGESIFPLAVATKASALGVPIAYIGSSPGSSIGQLSRLKVVVPVASKFGNEASVKSVQPMTSLFEQTILMLGDIIVLRLIHERNLNAGNMWGSHANLE